MTPNTPHPQLELEYTFSPREIRILARYFREHQNTIPTELEAFAQALESCVYNTMSIQEAELFYS